MVVLEFRFESYFSTCYGKNMVTRPWLTYRPSAGHNWPKTQILSSTKRQQVVNLTSFDDLWYSDFRLGVEKRSLPYLPVCDCALILFKNSFIALNGEIWIFHKYKNWWLHQIKCILSKYILRFSVGGRKTVTSLLTSVWLCLDFVQKLFQHSVRWNMNFSQVQKLMIASNQVYIV